MSGRTVIATRVIEVVDNPTARVTVSIYRPAPCRTGEWTCAYSIRGLSKRAGMTIRGFDALQALHGAMIIAGVMLETSEEGRRGALRWEGSKDLGFPKLPTPEGTKASRAGQRSSAPKARRKPPPVA